MVEFKLIPSMDFFPLYSPVAQPPKLKSSQKALAFREGTLGHGLVVTFQISEWAESSTLISAYETILLYATLDPTIDK